MRVSTRDSQRGQVLLLAITIISAIAAVVLLSREGSALGPQAGDYITAIPIRLSAKSDGIALIDTNNCTICIYQYQTSAPAHERFALLAVRSFRYDVQLEEYNIASPRPGEVKKLLERRSPETRASWHKQKPEDSEAVHVGGASMVEDSDSGN